MHSLRILVADDNEEAAAALAQLLAICDHEVRLAHDGREAVQIAREWRPDAVILDLEMPVMDGLHAAYELRALDPELALIAVSGLRGPTVRNETQRAGFDRYFAKPLDFHPFRRALEQLTADLRGGGRTAESQ
jgi:CheY-like chemotaxis protein